MTVETVLLHDTGKNLKKDANLFKNRSQCIFL